MFNVNLTEDIYCVDKACVFYPFKFGDFISLLYVCEAVRRYTRRNIKFSTTCNINSPSKDMIASSMFFTDYFVPHKKEHPHLPLVGNVFVWQVYLFEFHNIFPRIINNSKTQNRIILNPLMEGGTRKWSTKLINEFIEEFKNQNIVLVGKEKYNTNKIDQSFGNPLETIKLISSSKYYIGGETGFTLFSGVVENGPEKIAAIYGPKRNVDAYKYGFQNYVKQVYDQTDKSVDIKKLYTCFYPMTEKKVLRGYNDITTPLDVFKFFYEKENK